MAKPLDSDLPRWIATGKIGIVSTEKQDAGFDGNEQPPSQFFNWQWANTYKWLLYLSDFGDHDQEFTEDVIVTWEKLKYADRVINVPMVASFMDSKCSFNPTAYQFEWDGDVTYLDYNLLIPIPCDNGASFSIDQLAIDLHMPSGSTSIAFELWHRPAVTTPGVSTSPALIATANVSASNVPNTRFLNPGAHVIAPGDSVWVRFSLAVAATTTQDVRFSNLRAKVSNA